MFLVCFAAVTEQAAEDGRAAMSGDAALSYAGGQPASAGRHCFSTDPNCPALPCLKSSNCTFLYIDYRPLACLPACPPACLAPARPRRSPV